MNKKKIGSFALISMFMLAIFVGNSACSGHRNNNNCGGCGGGWYY